MRELRPFKLERYFALYEFKAKYLFSSSDCESLELSELLDLAADDDKLLWDGLKLGYTESTGHPLLKEQIAKLYNDVNDGNVLTVVPEEGIFIALNSLLESDDHVIIVAPSYQSLFSIPEWIGCNISFWNFHYSSKKGWFLDLFELEKLISKNTKAVIINFPHNPTGFIPDNQFIKELVNIIDKHGLWLFSDEMYKGLEITMTMPSFIDIYDKSIILSGLSKSYGLPGLRSGWLLVKNSDIMEKMTNFKDYTTICGSAPAEILSIIAIKNRDIIIKRNTDIVINNCNIFYDFVKEFPGFFEYYQIRGSSVGFFKYIGDGDAKNFCQNILGKLNIMMIYGEIFDFNGNFIRIGFGRKNFFEIIKLLRDKIYNL